MRQGRRPKTSPVSLLRSTELEFCFRCYLSRIPSESEVIQEKPLPADSPASASASTIGAALAASSGTGLSIPEAISQSQSKTSLPSQTPRDVVKEKKNRRNTLTVMDEPFSRTIKNRKGKTPSGETLAKASLATTPFTATTTTFTNHDDGYGAVACAGPSPDGHFPEYGQQGCTLVKRQSCVDYQGS